jgi:cytochrome c553
MLRYSLIVLWLFSTLSVASDSDVKQAAKPLIKQFAQALQGELKQAMQAGGPVNGIAACHIQAPKIAQDMNTNQWAVSRTSLKWRNPNNEPDAWERAQLESFNVKAKAGTDPKTLWAIHEDNKQVRVMKAIPTKAICLNCHGQTLMPEVAKKLAELYPEDRATGYKLGEIRGAFSLTKVK